MKDVIGKIQKKKEEHVTKTKRERLTKHMIRALPEHRPKHEKNLVGIKDHLITHIWNGMIQLWLNQNGQAK